MKELRNIISEYHKLKESHDLVLATVVKVRGSSYRSPGARMLIRNDGRWLGSISGGCLEGDALRKARQVIKSQKPLLVTYDTMDEANNSLQVSLGCNGIIDVLLEPIKSPDFTNPITLLQNLDTITDLNAIATVFRSELNPSLVGQRICLDENLKLHGEIKDHDLQSKTIGQLKEVKQKEIQLTKTYLNDNVEVLFELIEPVLSLHIYGGGFDAQPVAKFASLLGWDVKVTDECIAHLAPINFPNATLSMCKRDDFSSHMIVKPYSASILMSHNYDYDFSALEALLKTNISYIGILGPRKRGLRMEEEFERRGVKLTDFDKKRIHSPIGLDIGAETPEEIALSIVSEIKAYFSNREGQSLKHKILPIHRRHGDDNQIFRQVSLRK